MNHIIGFTARARGMLGGAAETYQRIGSLIINKLAPRRRRLARAGKHHDGGDH